VKQRRGCSAESTTEASSTYMHRSWAGVIGGLTLKRSRRERKGVTNE